MENKKWTPTEYPKMNEEILKDEEEKSEISEKSAKSDDFLDALQSVAQNHQLTKETQPFNNYITD